MTDEWRLIDYEAFGPNRVELAPGLAAQRLVTGERAWEAFRLAMTIEALPYADGRAGRFVCRSLELSQVADGPPVTSESIRRVPVATLVRELAGRLDVNLRDPDDPDLADSVWFMDRVREDLRDLGPVAESLKWVAALYRFAVAIGEPPTQAVERGLALPRSTAGRWVTLARREGYLGAAEGPGKAGG